MPLDIRVCIMWQSEIEFVYLLASRDTSQSGMTFEPVNWKASLDVYGNLIPFWLS